MMKELKRDSRGQILPKEVAISPTKEWGYFIGLILGDGYIAKTKTTGYRIAVESTRPETVNAYCNSAKALGLHCNYLVWHHKWRGETRIRYLASVYSKRLYDFFRLLKGKDSQFTLPPLVFQNQQCLCGFLQGYFDAEGTVWIGPRGKVAIEAYSKQASNLMQIQSCLDLLKIECYIINSKNKTARIVITDYDSRIKFKELISFRLSSKQIKLEAMRPLQRERHSAEIYSETMHLINQGYTYPQIQAELGVNRNTIAGWKFGKRPRTVIMEENYAKKRETNLCSL